jgi:hypothetical protein
MVSKNKMRAGRVALVFLTILFAMCAILSLVAAESNSKFYSLSLNYNKGAITINSFIVKAGAPSSPYPSTLNAYKIVMKDNSGKIVYSNNFDIPNIIYEQKGTDGEGNIISETEILDTVSFSLFTPYFEGIKTILIYDNNEKLVLKVLTKDLSGLKSPLQAMAAMGSVSNNCLEVVNHSSQNSQKANLIVIPDGYSQTQLGDFINNIVPRHLGINYTGQVYGNNYTFYKKVPGGNDVGGIFSRPPFNSTDIYNKFNIYIINENNTYGCWNRGCDLSIIYSKADECGLYNPYILVLVNSTVYEYWYSNYHLSVTPGYVENLTPITNPGTTTFVTGPLTTAHEFGHSFGLLGDENPTTSLSILDNFPNIDVANSTIACKKWCDNSLPPLNFSLFNAYPADPVECRTKLTKTICEGTGNPGSCFWNDTGWPYFGVQCIYKTGITNIGNNGTNCLPAQDNDVPNDAHFRTGCYHNGNGLFNWRPSWLSLMRGYYTGSLGQFFNQPSVNYTRALLSAYSSDLPAPLAAPTNFSFKVQPKVVNETNHGQPANVTLSWNPVAGAAGYKLYWIDYTNNLGGPGNGEYNAYNNLSVSNEVALGLTVTGWVVAYDSQGKESANSTNVSVFVAAPRLLLYKTFLGYGKRPTTTIAYAWETPDTSTPISDVECWAYVKLANGTVYPGSPFNLGTTGRVSADFPTKDGLNASVILVNYRLNKIFMSDNSTEFHIDIPPYNGTTNIPYYSKLCNLNGCYNFTWS